MKQRWRTRKAACVTRRIQGAARTRLCCRPIASHRGLSAPATMVLGDHRHLPLAVVAIGLAVTAADRPDIKRADVRDSRAFSRDVDDAATSRGLLTKQPAVTYLAGKATAG